MQDILATKNYRDSDPWISISDIMSGLMMIFLFISISYMINVKQEKDKIQNIAITYKSLKEDLYYDLKNEFKNDFRKWNAEIPANTLTIAFRDYFAQFKQGDYQLKPEFREILEDFFPRYIKVLMKYYKDIEEIRIEGHTSSEWQYKSSKDLAYFNNMKLSQDRTRSVLFYLLGLKSMKDLRSRIQKKITANGLSSSHLILFEDGAENKDASRRVEFVIKTNAENRINKILNGKGEK